MGADATTAGLGGPHIRGVGRTPHPRGCGVRPTPRMWHPPPSRNHNCANRARVSAVEAPWRRQ